MTQVPRNEQLRLPLANDHIGHIWFRKLGNRIVAMSVQLVKTIGDDAFQVYRADTAHGRLHEHVWTHGREQVRDLVAHGRRGDYTTALAEAWDKAKEMADADDPTRRAHRSQGVPEET